MRVVSSADTQPVAKRRGKQEDERAKLAVICIGLFLLLFGSVAVKVAAWLTIILSVIVLAFVLTLVADAFAWLHARSRGERRPFHTTASLAALMLYPYRLCRRLADWFSPPIRVQTIGELLTLTPTQFEEAIATVLRDRGYRSVQRVGRSGDLCVDITCRDPAGAAVAIQCKRYTPGHKVGSKDIQQFIGMLTVHHRADRGVYVTTSGYTRPARELAARHGIRLIDGQELARIIGPEGPPLPRPEPAARPVPMTADEERAWRDYRDRQRGASLPTPSASALAVPASSPSAQTPRPHQRSRPEQSARGEHRGS